MSGSRDSGPVVVYLFGATEEDTSAAYMHWTVEPGRAAGPLTAREVEVLRHLALEWEVAQIAAELGLSTRTVRNHSTNLRRKLDVGSSLDAVVVDVRLGLLTFDDGGSGVKTAGGATCGDALPSPAPRSWWPCRQLRRRCLARLAPPDQPLRVHRRYIAGSRLLWRCGQGTRLGFGWWRRLSPPSF